MRIDPTGLDGLLLISAPPSIDERGSFERLFCAEALAEAGVAFPVSQISLSRNSAAGTLRGLHWQRAPHGETKIVRCIAGAVFDVAVDLRPESPTYCQWRGFELSAASGRGLAMTAGFAHGFLTLTDEAVLAYAMAAPYAAASACGARYDDPAFGIDWPAAPAVIAARDLAWPAFAR